MIVLTTSTCQLPRAPCPLCHFIYTLLFIHMLSYRTLHCRVTCVQCVQLQAYCEWHRTIPADERFDICSGFMILDCTPRFNSINLITVKLFMLLTVIPHIRKDQSLKVKLKGYNEALQAVRVPVGFLPVRLSTVPVHGMSKVLGGVRMHVHSERNETRRLIP